MSENKSIVYIAVGAYNLLGVKDKIKSKIQELQKYREDVVALYFCNDIKEEIVEGNIRFIPFRFTETIPKFWQGRFFWRLQEYYIRKQKFKIIYQELQKIKSIKGIIFRYMTADLNLLFFTLRHFKKIVFEHNILEVEELKLLPKTPSNQYYYYSEIFFGGLVRLQAKGLISVTKQIASYEKQRSCNLTKSFVVSNGVDLANYPFVSVNKYVSGDVNVLFSCGFANPVHGLDLLINSVLIAENVILHLVGDFIIDDMVDSPRIIFHGKLKGEEYDKLYSNCHVAVSPLAIYRKNLTEASSLKNREYCCRGIPFILGHRDADFENFSIAPYIFKTIVSEEQQIDFEKVKDFLNGIQKRDYHEMRDYAENNLHYRIKAREYELILKKLFG